MMRICFIGLLIVWCLVPGTAAAGDGGHTLTFIGTADLQGHLDPASRSVDLEDNGKKITVVGGISRLA
ncbi:MAG: hypothetical protein ABFS19_14770, partial [Thermodesulfobacteriota bacterium]